ncbi:MAG: hypothetical protein QM711_02205 [Micropruina sp.]|uniref:hypothetical protein n=1 Tax=Micropruina sp. TaxID=2737536 RepID=UPI0039E5AF7E
MPKRPSKHLRPPRPLSSSFASAVDKSDGRWMTQTMPGQAATKQYHCPGCDRPIAVGTPHVVVWPQVPTVGSSRAVDERRHWHNSCWNRRR